MRDGRDLYIDRDGTTFRFHEPDPLARRARAVDATRIVAPVSGLVRAVEVKAGDTVAKGQMVAMIEAMKMENALLAQMDGRIAAIHVAAGEQVRAGDLVAEIGSVESSSAT